MHKAMIKPMLAIRHKTICTKSRTMTLSMKPDLQKPTSPSSFSGLIGATTGSMVTKPKVTAEVDAGIRPSENQIKILALRKFQFRIQKLTIRHGNGVNCCYFIWFTSIPAQWSGRVKRHFSFRKQSIHLCGLLVLEHEHQFHAPLPLFSLLCFLHSKIRFHFFWWYKPPNEERSFIKESLLLLAFTK